MKSRERMVVPFARHRRWSRASVCEPVAVVALPNRYVFGYIPFEVTTSEY